MKKNKLLYKKIGPAIGNFLDRMFFTDFGKRANNFTICTIKMIIHSMKINIALFMFLEPEVGHLEYFNNYKLPFYVNEKQGHHNPVSVLCSLKKI